MIQSTFIDELLLAKVLERAEYYDWSLQGLGMLRMYLSKEARLHVWDKRFAVANVSTIHNHPWHFEAECIAGSITNIVYNVVNGAPTHHRQVLACGQGGHLEPIRDDVRLAERYRRTITPHRLAFGERVGYRMQATELHETAYEDGTITVCRREFLEDTEHAQVCFPIGTDWISAEPRKATIEEVRAICGHALTKLRQESSVSPEGS